MSSIYYTYIHFTHLVENLAGSPLIDGGGWKLVRHTPAGNKWHTAKDQLRGTDSYGTPSGPTSDEAWSIPFDNEKFNQFLFATGTVILGLSLFIFAHDVLKKVFIKKVLYIVILS